MPPLDPAKALLKEPDFFQRFRVPERGGLLKEAQLKPDELLLLIERGSKRRAFLARQLAYHHVAQGELAGEPYLVAF